MIAEFFPNQEENVFIGLTIALKFSSPEVYLQIITKYLNEKNSKNLMLQLLSQASQCIKKIVSEVLLAILPSIFDNLANCLNHKVIEVRKLAVITIVELYTNIGRDFEPYLNKLNSTHLNLVKIYIKKQGETKNT